MTPVAMPGAVGAVLATQVDLVDDVARLAAPAAERTASATIRAGTLDAVAAVDALRPPTRDGVFAELAAILDTNADDVTTDQLRRIAAIDQLPAELRPNLPPPRVGAGYEPLGRVHAAVSDQDVRRELSHLQVWLESERIAADPTVTRDALKARLDTILAKRLEDVTADDMRFVSSLDMLHGEQLGDLVSRLGGTKSRFQLFTEFGLPGNQAALRCELASLRLDRAVEQRAADPAFGRADALRELAVLLEVPAADFGPEHMHRMAVLESLPSQLRPYLGPRVGTSTWRSNLVNGLTPANDVKPRALLEGVKLLKAHTQVLLDPATTKASVQAEFDAIVAMADSDITPEHVQRLAVLSALPVELMPNHAPATHSWDLWKLASGGMAPSTHPYAAAEFASLRFDRDLRVLHEAGPQARAAVVARLDSILDTPDQAITHDQIRDLAFIDRLPDLLPTPLPVSIGVERVKLHLFGNLPSSSFDAADELGWLRLWREANALSGDPAMTRSVLTDELARIAITPDTAFTPDHLRRIARMQLVDPVKRPAIPSSESVSWERLWRTSLRSMENDDVVVGHVQLRQWAMLETDIGRQFARTQARQSGTLDTFGIASLVHASDDELIEFGVTRRELLDRTVESIRSLSTGGPRRRAAELTSVIGLIEDLAPTVEPARTLRDEATRLLRANVDRITSTEVGDGPAGHPDYAEVGRALAYVDTLRTIDDASRARMTDLAETSVAAAPLVW